MRTYIPDSWVPLLIESPQHGKVYKILAGWYGGFAGSNSWKLSSGIESIKVEADGSLTMPQSSGSTYSVGTNTHMSSLMYSVFSGFEKEAADKGFVVKELTVNELLTAFNVER